jgi:hypothetical protein
MWLGTAQEIRAVVRDLTTTPTMLWPRPSASPAKRPGIESAIDRHHQTKGVRPSFWCGYYLL